MLVCVLNILHVLKYHYEVYILKKRVPSTALGDEESKLIPVVTQLKNTVVCGESGFIFDQSGLLLVRSAPIAARSKIRRPILMGAPILSEGKVFHLVGESSYNRAHFMIEHGVRLMLAHDSGELKNCKTIMVHPRSMHWINEYLEFFDGATMSLIQSPKLSLRVPNMSYVPGPSSELLRYSESVYRRYCGYLQKRVEHLLGCADKSEGYAVWISRKDAPNRRCENIEKLQEAFIKETAVKVIELTLSDYSLREQLILLREARVIVAEEGQSLNLIPFITNSTLIILDKGQAANQSLWNQTFSRIAGYAGNQVYNLFSGTGEGALSWVYKTDEFVKDLTSVDELRD